MFEITRLTVEHLAAGCVTDCSTPRIGFSLSSDRRGAQLADAELTVGDWSAHVTSGQSAAYVGPALLPFTTYSVRLNATDDAGETATATTAFETGRMETPWKGRWISDPSYHFTEAKVSPVPMVFRKEITTNKPIARARLYATAMGIPHRTKCTAGTATGRLNTKLKGEITHERESRTYAVHHQRYCGRAEPCTRL